MPIKSITNYFQNVNNKEKGGILLVAVISAALVVSLFFHSSSAATTWTQTSQVDFEAGTLTNIDTTTVSGQLSLLARTDLAENKWASAVEISTAIDTQQRAKIVADGSGGAIIAWQDARNGVDLDIYAQKVNSSGTVQWTSNGESISAVIGSQWNLEMVTDGSGGAIIIWIDDRNTTNDIYAQRISSSGTVLWTSDGIRLTNTGSARIIMNCISDGAGGAIIAWEDNRGIDTDIYAQRIDSSGASQWTSNGVVITNEANEQLRPKIASDGGSGAIIVWEDWRDLDKNIYAQKINSLGVVQWTANGLVISSAANDQTTPEIIDDNLAGAIIVWTDTRNGNNDIYAQKIDTAGDVSWTANGVVITTELGDQKYPALATNGAGGAIIAWIDDAISDNIYAQEIDSTGVVQWAVTGEYVSGAVMSTSSISIISDGAQGAILAWEYNSLGDFTIFAQKIKSSTDGSFQSVWTDGGSTTAFTIAAVADWYPSPVLATDGNGGAIAAWEDVAGDENIYAQKFGTKLEYLTAGTYISPIYDAGSMTTFIDIEWTENLPPNTDITLQTRTADSIIVDWRDDFDDGNVSNVISGDVAFPGWGSGLFDSPTEPGGILTFVNPEPAVDDYYLQIDTGQPADYYPGGSVVTARVAIITEELVPAVELYMFVDGWDIDSSVIYTTSAADPITYTIISYITDLSEPFNTIGFDLYRLNHQLGDNDQFLIDWITIEPPAGSGNFSAWSAELLNPLGNAITSPDGRYLQYRANFSTTDISQTPTLDDVTINIEDAGDLIDPTVLFYSPVDDATGVAITVDLVLTFNEDIQVGTGNVFIKKVSDDSTVETIDIAGSLVAFNGTTVTVNPTANFLYSTAYYILIDNTAIEDLAGNAYAGIADTTTWNFTTVGISGGGGYGPQPTPPVEPIEPEKPADEPGLILTDPAPAGVLPPQVQIGTLIKSPKITTVYFIDQDNRRHAFPNLATYFSYYPDFSGVKIVSDSVIAVIPIGSNVTIRPGTSLVKIYDTPKIYAVESYGVLRWIPSEAIAQALYGIDWKTRIVEIDVTFFSNYQAGAEISASIYPTGSVFSYQGDASVYYLDYGKKRYISAAVFGHNKFQNKFIIRNLAPSIIFPDGADLPSQGMEAIMTLR